MMTYELVAGDGGSTVHITILDRLTQEPIDLTGKTVTLRYAVNGGTTVNKTMTVLNQTTHKGQAQYQVLTTDLTAAGTLEGEVRVQAGQADQLTSVDTFHLAVRAALP